MKLESSTMAEKNKEEKTLIAGNQVRVVTVSGMQVQGEVVGYDSDTRFLFLRRPVAGQHERVDVSFFNLNQLSKVENIGDEVAVVPEALPYVPIPKVTSRLRSNISEFRRQKTYLGENVSPEGQLLMDSISKTITDVKWDNETIVVMDCVTITPPYTSNQLRLIPGKENVTTLAHIRKMVEKHQQDERSRQAHAQNNRRRSTSPSPAPSSSSTSSAS